MYTTQEYEDFIAKKVVVEAAKQVFEARAWVVAEIVDAHNKAVAEASAAFYDSPFGYHDDATVTVSEAGICTVQTSYTHCGSCGTEYTEFGFPLTYIFMADDDLHAFLAKERETQRAAVAKAAAEKAEADAAAELEARKAKYQALKAEFEP